MSLDPSSLLPEEEPGLAPEDELGLLDDMLDAATDLDAVDVEAAPEPVTLGRSWAFDFDARRFVGGRSPLTTYGLATLRGWIEKCLMTERGSASSIHPPDYGVEGLEDVIGQPLVTAATDLERRIREALLFHPAISDVTDFYVDTDDESEALLVSFTVVTEGADDLIFDAMRLGA